MHRYLYCCEWLLGVIFGCQKSMMIRGRIARGYKMLQIRDERGINGRNVRLFVDRRFKMIKNGKVKRGFLWFWMTGKGGILQQ